MVTGGHASEQHLSSTEIYVNLAWSYAASLPSPRSYLSAATVMNSVLVFGKILFLLIITFFIYLSKSIWIKRVIFYHLYRRIWRWFSWWGPAVWSSRWHMDCSRDDENTKIFSFCHVTIWYIWPLLLIFVSTSCTPQDQEIKF